MTGELWLAYATIDALFDNPATWPPQVRLNGLRYAAIRHQTGRPPVRERLDWIDREPYGYRPQPYEQLASWYRSVGHDDDARRVLLAKQRRRRETLPAAAKLWGYVQDLTVAYGYRPGRAAVWMALLWAASSVAFTHADHPPIKSGEHPPWNPALFALDLLLPVIELGQVGFFRLRGGWQWLAAAMILVGWILATTVAAGATRLLRRG
jgi:hypothetical protein